MTTAQFLHDDGQTPAAPGGAAGPIRRGLIAAVIVSATGLAAGAVLAGGHDRTEPVPLLGPRWYPPAYRWK